MSLRSSSVRSQHCETPSTPESPLKHNEAASLVHFSPDIVSRLSGPPPLSSSFVSYRTVFDDYNTPSANVSPAYTNATEDGVDHFSLPAIHRNKQSFRGMSNYSAETYKSNVPVSIMTQDQLLHLHPSDRSGWDRFVETADDAQIEYLQLTQVPRYPQLYVRYCGFQRLVVPGSPVVGLYCPFVTLHDLWVVAQDVLLLTVYAIISYLLLG